MVMTNKVMRTMIMEMKDGLANCDCCGAKEKDGQTADGGRVNDIQAQNDQGNVLVPARTNEQDSSMSALHDQIRSQYQSQPGMVDANGRDNSGSNQVLSERVLQEARKGRNSPSWQNSWGPAGLGYGQYPRSSRVMSDPSFINGYQPKNERAIQYPSFG